ncbi:MAG TPA: methylmalonyl Co-A mutase-associated GTPase MeaB [Balneolales bacterium]|nr:methylmalonyl Co-A mutase-associated GTPase MeaB [Balneolales bacterium]
MKQKQKIHILVKGLLNGNRRSLARAITMIENSRSEAIIESQQILEQITPHTGKSIRIGITGVPGVGKSTFIEKLGMMLIEKGHKIAVLAVDPSSAKTGGSILGDKTRMEKLSGRTEAFIRPSPTGGKLGGVARKTRESMLLCEAAGYDIILIETVGVGQSEYEVASMVDLFMLLMLPGAGDTLQGLKRGILELADMLIINKAEEDNKTRALHSRRDYKNALHLLKPKYEDIPIPVILSSAITGEGIPEIWDYVLEFIDKIKDKGIFEENRNQQQWDWMVRLTEEQLLQEFWSDPNIKKQIPVFKEKLRYGNTTAVLASQALLSLIKSKKKEK